MISKPRLTSPSLYKSDGVKEYILWYSVQCTLYIYHKTLYGMHSFSPSMKSKVGEAGVFFLC